MSNRRSTVLPLHVLILSSPSTVSLILSSRPTGVCIHNAYTFHLVLPMITMSLLSLSPPGSSAACSHTSSTLPLVLFLIFSNLLLAFAQLETDVELVRTIRTSSGDTEVSSSSLTPSSRKTVTLPDGWGYGHLAGVIVGVIVGVIILSCLLLWCCWNGGKRKDQSHHESYSQQGYPQRY